MRRFPAGSIEKLLETAVSQLDLELSARQISQLATHFSLLLRWNQKINLTSLRRPEEIATRHFEESLFLTKLVKLESGLLSGASAQEGLLVDVGSGAGFPGLPIKIACPSLAVVLLEPNKKKSAFLKEVVRHCGLEGVEVCAERLEEVTSEPRPSGSGGQGRLVGKASLVTLRAVKPQRELLSNLARLLAPGGQVALFLGTNDATAVATTPGFQWSAPVAIPHSERRVILVGRSA